MNFSNVSPFHRLLLFMNCPSVGLSHRVQSFRNRLLQRGSPTGSQALPANLLQPGLLSPRVYRSWQKPAPAWVPHGVTVSFRHPPAPAWGPFHGLQVDICSIVDLHGLQGDSLPHHGLQHELQGKTLCSGISSSCSRSFPYLGVCRVVSFTPSHSPLLTGVLTAVLFLPLLKYVITEAPPPSLIGLALASGGSVLEPAGTGFIRHGGSFSQLLTEATPIAPRLPKPCHANP